MKNSQIRKHDTKKVKSRKKESPMFCAYMSEWVETYKRPNLKPSSLHSLCASLRYAEEAFQDKMIADTTSNDIQNLLLGITAERVKDLCKINLI